MTDSNNLICGKPLIEPTNALHLKRNVQDDSLVTPTDEFVDEIAAMANPSKYTWSDADKEEVRFIAVKIIERCRRYFQSVNRGQR